MAGWWSDGSWLGWWYGWVLGWWLGRDVGLAEVVVWLNPSYETAMKRKIQGTTRRRPRPSSAGT